MTPAKDNKRHTCPACGFMVFDEPAGSYDICPVCGWEDDAVQLRFPAMRGGANQESLYEWQLRTIQKNPLPTPCLGGFNRDPHWRPLRQSDMDHATDMPSTGTDYFKKAGDMVEPYYYWKVD